MLITFTRYRNLYVSIKLLPPYKWHQINVLNMFGVCCRFNGKHKIHAMFMVNKDFIIIKRNYNLNTFFKKCSLIFMFLVEAIHTTIKKILTILRVNQY